MSRKGFNPMRYGQSGLDPARSATASTNTFASCLDLRPKQAQLSSCMQRLHINLSSRLLMKGGDVYVEEHVLAARI